MSTENSHASLYRLSRRILPRLLTQVCRDPGSPFFGCFDRNWWHYKIRDFPSLILQQGGYALALAAQQIEETMYDEIASLRFIAYASGKFWAERAVRHGAFEEYYPWEQGYPPLAFATLSVMKLYLDDVVGKEVIYPGVKVAARQLQKRFEAQAGNQQVAGLAALAAIAKAFPEEVDQKIFQQLSQRTLALQHEEGWYTEYDGPDLGYLTVTMDCLWDLFDFTDDPSYRASAARALSFLEPFVDARPEAAGMHNARNTDYLVPYGIARFAVEDGPESISATRIFHRLFDHADSPQHFFAAIDDRYFSHYIGHSIFRCLSLPAIPAATEKSSGSSIQFFPGSGHVIRDSQTDCGVMLSLRKGGILSLFTNDGAYMSDYGWLVRSGSRICVTHWWSPSWVIDAKDGTYSTEGRIYPHREQVSRPWKHMILRLCSLFLGRRIIAWLKKTVIFKKGSSAISFRRSVRLTAEGAEVTDTFEGLTNREVILDAPRMSKRHVASADSFHHEDLNLSLWFACEEIREKKDDRLMIRRIYSRISNREEIP